VRPGGARVSTAARAAGVLGALGVALLVAIVPTGAAVAAPESPVEILPPVTVGDGAFAVGVSPDGSLAYVLALVDQELHVVDTATNTPILVIPMSISLGFLDPSLVVHPDGRVLILDPGDGAGVTEPAIIEIDPTTWDVYTHSLAQPAPWDAGFAVSLALTPDGTKAYVADLTSGRVLAVSVPPTAGPGAWSITPIDVAAATTPEILPGSLAIAGGTVYALDILGEDGGEPTGIAAIRVADDQLEPTVIAYSAPAGTTGGILTMPTMKPSPDGTTVLISGAAEFDDGSGDTGGFFWTIPGGTVPAAATYLGGGLGDEVAAFAFGAAGQTVYLIDCACASLAWTLDVGSGTGTILDVAAATDLDMLASVAVSPDGTRIFLTGTDLLGDSRLWQLSAVADDVLHVTGPTAATQGDRVTLTAIARDNSGNPIDVTSLATFTSSVATDVISGNVVAFPHASPHTITASYAPLAGGPAVAAGSIMIEVAAVLPPTGVEDPRPWLGAAAALLLAGATLVLTRSRLSRRAPR